MQFDIIIFQLVIAISPLIFIIPIRKKYFAFLLPVVMLMAVSSIWAFNVIRLHEVKTIELTFNLWGQVPSFWSTIPKITIDQISALFILMINIITFGSVIYAYGYLKNYLQSKSSLGISMHLFSFFLLYLSLILLTMVRDGFLFLFAWELMSLSSFVLIAFDAEKPNVMKIAINYLVQMHIGFFFLLAAFLIANKETGIWGFDALPYYFKTHNNVPLFILFFLGFGVKTGLIPFHSWAAKADPVAPPHISSLMSGVLVKMGIFGILRVSMDVQANFSEIASIILPISLISILFAISMSIYQNDLRKLLAYSSIENMGVICLGIALSFFGKAHNIPALCVLGMLGAVFHVISHSLYKSMLFLLTGNIERITGTRNLNELGGLAKKMPVTSAFFLLGGLSLCALPPFNGFVSEFLMYKGAFKAIATADFFTSVICILVVVVMAISGGLSIYAMTKAFGLAFLGSNRKEYPKKIEEPSKLMLFPAFLNSTLMLLLGLAPMLIFPEIYQTISTFHFIPQNEIFYANQVEIFQKFGFLSLILVSIVLIMFVIRYFQQKRVEVKYGPTWGCGYPAGDAKHQYTSTSYGSPLKRMVSPMLKETNTYQPQEEEEIFPSPRTFKTEIKDRVEHYTVTKPVEFLLKYVPKLGLAQTGRIQHYLIYPLAFLLLVAILTAFNFI
jgi:hydrogenase-4 component B